jgi:SAM-dependent methyltransferase
VLSMIGDHDAHTYSLHEGYDSLAADLLYRVADQVPIEELDFYAARIRANGGPALDVACGVGRHAIPLAERGLDITGIDSSRDALRWARERAAARSVSPEFHEQTMQALELPRRFGTVYIPNGSFQLLQERRVARAALECFRRHLSPGGELLVDFGTLVQHLDAHVRQLDPKEPWVWSSGVRASDSSEIRTRSWIDYVSRFEQRSLERREYQLLVKGRCVRTEQHVMALRFYSPDEAVLLLEAVGFTDMRWFANHREAPPEGDDFTSIVCSARG